MTFYMVVSGYRSISLNLKIAPVPYLTPKWPIENFSNVLVWCEDILVKFNESELGEISYLTSRANSLLITYSPRSNTDIIKISNLKLNTNGFNSLIKSLGGIFTVALCYYDKGKGMYLRVSNASCPNDHSCILFLVKSRHKGITQFFSRF